MTTTETATTEVLTDTETLRLGVLERVIERGMQTFVEVGRALAEIRDGRLYRTGHATFEAYCRERWGFSRQHAYRAVDAASIAELVSPTGDTPRPSSERVARELVPLKGHPEQMREAWAETVAEHGPKPTAKQVRTRVNLRVVAEQAVRDAADAAISEAEAEREWRLREERSVLTPIAMMTGAATGAVERLRAYDLDTTDLAHLKRGAANVKQTRAALREITAALDKAIKEGSGR
jgi:hypothetical protein